MAHHNQPDSPTQDATASSEINSIEHTTTDCNDTVLESKIDLQESPVVYEICQRIDNERRNDFDFEVNDGSIDFIQDEDDYRRKLHVYKRSDDVPPPENDFPTDPVSHRMLVEEIAKALTNREGAIDLNTFGTLITRLRETEISSLAWMVLVSFQNSPKPLATTLKAC